jgi:hypothetical protein
MRRLTAIVVLTAALAAAPPAAAKEIVSVQACAADRCVTSKDEAVLTALMHGGTPAPPQDGAPSVSLRASVGDGRTGEVFDTFTMEWVPARRMLVGEDGTWMRVPPAAGRALDRLSRSVAAPPPARRSRSAPAPGDGARLAWVLVAAAAIALPLGAVLLLRHASARPAS